VVVDRLAMRHDIRKRLADSIETAVGLADGLVEIEIVAGSRSASDGGDGDGVLDAGTGRAHSSGALGVRAATQIVPGEKPQPGSLFTFSEKFACPEHGPSLVELEPRIFSFNSPHGACERCTGLGSQMVIDPELVVPDPSLSVGEGAIAPWANSASNYYEQVTEAIAKRYGVDLGAPWEELPQEHRDLFLSGTNGEPLQITYRNRYGRSRSYGTRFEGVVANLQRRYRETDSEWTREKIEEFMSLRACPECGGARLRPESRAVLVAGTRIEDFCGLSARRALAWLEEVELSETDRHVARLILREISERLQFLENVGIGYLSMDRAASTLSGGEAQRIRLATQIGSSLVGVLYILDEPSIGLHQRDNAKLIATLERLRDLGNTVIVVEHDEQTTRCADHPVDLGRARGIRRVDRRRAPPLRCRCEGVSHRPPLVGTRTIEAPAGPHAHGVRGITGATQHNLRDIDVRPPWHFTCVTGVSGSG
jgi:excinuclease ABC subunit A